MSKKDSERLTILLVIIVLAISIFFDTLSFIGCPILRIDSFSNFIQVVIQVQATIATLGLTIVTLLGNVIDRRIFGVNVADFIMNLQGKFLTQKNAIVFCIVSVLISTVVYLAGLYNLIFGLFIASLIIVLYMVMSICYIFQNEEKITEEIRAYILTHLENKEIIAGVYGEPKKNRDRLNGYFLAQYKELLLELWNESLKLLSVDNYNAENVKLFSIVLNGQKNAISDMLKSKNTEKYSAAIELLCNSYKKYNEEGNIVRNAQTEMTVFSDVYTDLIYQWDYFDKKDIYRALLFIPEDVFKSSIYLNDDKIEETKDAGVIGDYYKRLIFRLNSEGMDSEISIILSSFSSCNIARYLDRDFECDDELIKIRRLYAKSIITTYMLAVVISAPEEVVQEVFFDKYLNTYYYSKSNDEDEVILTILAYFHYLIYSEDKNLLKESGFDHDVKCRALWKDNAASIERYFNRIYAYHEISIDIIENVYKALRAYEIWGRQSGKALIMEDSIKEFIVITAALYAINDRDLERLYSRIIRDNEYFIYYEQFCQKNVEDKIKHEIACFCSHNLDKTIEFKLDENAKNRVDIAYRKIAETLSKLYALSALHSVQAFNNNYDESKEESDLQHKLKEHVQELFSNIKCIDCSDDCDEEKESESGAVNICIGKNIYTLLNATLPTQFATADSVISQFGSILDANLIMLIRTLLQNNKIVAINDFSKTAAGLKEYINSRNASYDVAIGTQSSWLEASLEDYQAFRNVLDSIDALLIHSIGNEKFLIDLDSSKISIKIAGLNAKVRDFTDKEIEQEFRAENGIYKVNVTNDIWLPYSHDDALDYIRKSKKAVEITGRIIIRTFDDPGRIVILG